MKDIFIMAHSMDIGGAEMSLLGLLENINYKEYSVDLFLLRHQGELLKFIPSEVTLLSEIPQYASLGVPILKVIQQRHIRIAYRRIVGKKIAQIKHSMISKNKESNIINEYSHKYTVSCLPEISTKKYDVAISFVSPHYFVLKKVRAKKKIAWIHTDYSTLIVDQPSELKMWKEYDKIISISPDVTTSFLNTFPTLEKKICLIENIIPENYMYSRSNECSVDCEMPDFNGINLLSIGRFVPQKRFTDIPEICRNIKDNGINVKWYIIGFGMLEQLIRQKIREFKVEDSVIVLGKKENPYPYIKRCDVYVQPSNYEGKSIAVREAQILHKPVIITNYSTADSQLENGVDGFIVPLDIKQCALGIAKRINDKEALIKISKNTTRKDYINKSQIKIFYSLIEGITNDTQNSP